MTTDFKIDGESPDLSTLMNTAAAGKMHNFYAALVCEVTSYDAVKQCADVQPVSKTFDADRNAVKIPVIPCCPVAFPSAGGFAVTFPLAAGDVGLLVLSSRSFAPWWVSGNPDADPESRRVGSLNDGVFIPGVVSQVSPLPGAALPTLRIGKSDGTSTLEVDGAGNATMTQNLAATGTLTAGAGSSSATNDTLLQAELAKIAATFAAITPSPPPAYVPAATALNNISGD